jgi:hypothetical protein
MAPILCCRLIDNDSVLIIIQYISIINGNAIIIRELAAVENFFRFYTMNLIILYVFYKYGI